MLDGSNLNSGWVHGLRLHQYETAGNDVVMGKVRVYYERYLQHNILCKTFSENVCNPSPALGNS